MAYKYLCVTIGRDGNRWEADVAISGRKVRERTPTLVLNRLVDVGCELVSASYSHSFVPNVGSVPRHVLWLKAEQLPSVDVEALS